MLRTCLLIGILLGITGPGRAETGANRIWERPIRVSRTGTEPHAFQDLVRGRGPAFKLHAVVNQQLLRASVRVFHLTVDRDLDWDEAWEGRTEFTFDPGGRYIANVPVTVIDASDRVHVVHESFNTLGQPTVHIAYKTDAWSHWNRAARPALLSPTDDPSCMGVNPGAVVAEGADGVEWLHVLYTRRSRGAVRDPAGCRSFWYVHNAKPLSVADPGEGWAGESWFTDMFVEQEYLLAGEGAMGLAPIVDSQGAVHAIGREKSRDTDSVRVYHIRGNPPRAGQEWCTTSVCIDSMALGRPEPGDPAVWSTTQAILGSSEEGEHIDAVWSRNIRDEEAIRKEVWYARFVVESGEWTTPFQISPEDGVSSHGPRLDRSRDGTLHVIYHEPSARDPAASLHYVRTRGDPGVRENWTEPVPVTADLGTYAYLPVFVAEEDTLWLGYTSGRAGTDGKGTPQAWFRKGYPIGDASAADATWEGLVWLASDYVVRAGHTLTVRPGTRVIAAERSGVDRPGFTPREVDVIVEGTIIAAGTEADPIRFESVAPGGDGDVEWGGIRLVSGSERSRFEHCVVRNARCDDVVSARGSR